MKPVKRAVRQKRQRIPVRASRAQVHYLRPDPDKPHRVRVYISPTRQHMRTTIDFVGDGGACAHTMGMVCSYTSQVDSRCVVRPGLVIANMFLNADDLRTHPTEIASHECAHAAMAWARLRRANLAVMDGEEVMCHALGRMTRQLTILLYAIKIFP